MSKPEIKYEDIPDEEIETSTNELVKKRYWYPKRQKSKFQPNDNIYIELKNYFINFYNSQPKTQFLYWAPIYEEKNDDEKGSDEECGCIDVDDNIDAGNSWLIGDHSRDILAGQAAGLKTILMGQRSENNENQEHISNTVHTDMLIACQKVLEEMNLIQLDLALDGHE